MASIFDNLFPSAAVDVVGVFDSNFQQLFRQARAIKAVVKEESKPMEHPLETGATTTDHRIILPVEIELSLVIQLGDISDVYKTIKQFFLNGTSLTVRTKTGVYEDQLILGMPHEEGADNYDAIFLALSLKQTQFAITQFGVVPKAPTNKKTSDRGVQQATPPSNISILASGTDAATAKLKRIFG